MEWLGVVVWCVKQILFLALYNPANWRVSKLDMELAQWKYRKGS